MADSNFLIDSFLNHDRMVDWFEETGRPFVTLSWAQTLDGSLALVQGKSSPISGAESYALTHQIRSQHDAILIGIGTALSDNPRLTARTSNNANSQPRPIVLDSLLRMPPNLRLFDHPQRPIIAVTCQTSEQKMAEFNRSADILKLKSTSDGRVPLDALLDSLGQQGVKSIMVEGGGRVLTSFLNSGCANQAIVTIAPVFAGGYDAIHRLQEASWSKLPRLENMQTFKCGADLVVAGSFTPKLPAD